MFQTGILYLENLNATEDIIVNQGGTASGKTYAIMQVLVSLAISNNNLIITATAESVPHIERGLLRDLQAIIASDEIIQGKVVSYNATKRTYSFVTGSIIEMPVFPDVMSAHGPKRDVLFINEAPSFSYTIFEQLMDRTRLRTYLDYNPSIPFWVHERLLPTKVIGNKKVRLIISDHRHNPFLTPEQHDHIEKKAEQDPEWGRVYARGLTGKIEGLIYKNWNEVDAIPEGAKFLGNGLDFGFVNDVTASVDVYLCDGELWIDEILYELGLINVPVAGAQRQEPNISDKLKALNYDRRKEIIADSAEMKSIKELEVAGWKIKGVKKGEVMDGIEVVKRYKMNVTKHSYNVKKELRKYKWKTDKNTGLSLNEPIDKDNHAMDAIRYLVIDKLKPYPSGKYSIY